MTRDPEVTIPGDFYPSTDAVGAFSKSWEEGSDYTPSNWHELVGDGEHLTIGIGDTGIDLDHPLLSDLKIKAQQDFTNSQSGPDDRNTHGTFVCHQIYRMLPKAKFVIAKVLNDNGSGTSSGIVRGCEFMASEGVDAINLSLGSGGSYQPMGDFLKTIMDSILVFAASGNSGGSMGWPARWGINYGVIPVGAHDKNGRRANFSSFGEPLMALGAGVNVVGAKAQTSGLMSASGSSMGTPDVVASFMGYTNGLRGLGYADITAPQAKSKLVESIAVDIQTPGRDQQTGFGNVSRIKVGQLLEKENEQIVGV